MLQPFDDTADGGPVVGNQLRDARLVRGGVGMNGVERGELDRRQVEPRRLRALDENLRRSLMQAAYQVSRHFD